MENRQEKLIALVSILIVLMWLEIWFLNQRVVLPILSTIGSLFGASVIALYVFGIIKVYFQK